MVIIGFSFKMEDKKTTEERYDEHHKQRLFDSELP